MRADLSACSAQGLDAWLLGLLLSVAVAVVPFLFSLRRDRPALGCALSVLLLAATPAVWLLEPMAGIVPFHWLDCGRSSRAIVLAAMAPVTVLLLATALSVLVWAASRRTHKSPPTEAGLSS